MSWYVRIGGQQLGPLSDDALRALAQSGKVEAESQVWCDGMPEWVAAKHVPGLLASPAQPVPAVAAPAAAAERVPLEPVVVMKLAHAWPRFWARMVDLFVAIMVLMFPLGGAFPSWFRGDGLFAGRLAGQLLTWLIGPFAFALDAGIHALFGNTLGKAIAGIQIRSVEGERLTFARYLRRNAGVYWSGLGTTFPLISLFTLSNSHKRVSSGLLASWDESLETRAFTSARGPLRTWAIASVYFLVIVAAQSFSVYRQARDARIGYVANAADPEARLLQTAAEVQKTCPTFVDDSTRLDGAQAGPGRRFTYNYTLVKVTTTAANHAAVRARFENSIRPRLHDSVCTAPAFRELRALGATIGFRYNDSAGAVMGDVAIAPGDCDAPR